MKEIKMFCPKCHKPLIKGKDREFETLCDHVSDPNREHYPLRPTWICNNPNCECGQDDVFWDEMGDYYGGFRIEFENDISSAYPSFSRKQDIEIYGKGLKRKIYLHPILMLWFLKPMIEFQYKSNEMGEVLGRTWYLKWLKKDSFWPWKRDRMGYHIYYTFPIVHIIQSFKWHIRIIKEGSDVYKLSHFKDHFKPLPSWDKRWWRHFELWLAKIIFRKWYLKALNTETKKRS